jgi:hypothetical protein
MPRPLDELEGGVNASMDWSLRRNTGQRTRHRIGGQILEVRHNGRTVGRILRLRSTSRELWQWTQIGWGPSHAPNGGVAHTLDEAKAAFRAAWGRPLPEGKVDKICSP